MAVIGQTAVNWTRLAREQSRNSENQETAGRGSVGDPVGELIREQPFLFS